MTRWSHIPLVLVSALALSYPAAAAPRVPPGAPEANDNTSITTEDIKAAYEKDDYPETLRLLGRVLALKGKAAEGYDRYELFMLRAEAHLRVKAQSAALTALEEAEKIAAEDKLKADAHALSVLIKRSKNLQYAPKVAVAPAADAGAKDRAGDGKGGGAERGAGGPFDITDPKQREAALAALYAEEKALARPKVKEADRAKTLVPVENALQAVMPLRPLELASTGSQSETGETLKDLADRAHKLMAKSLDDMTRRTERIAERANQIVTYQVNRRDGSVDTRTSRQGLARGDADELKRFVTDCGKIIKYSKELAASFPDDSEPFEDLEDQARDVGERAHEVRTDNYSNIR